jgi:hypothetical protein
MLKNLTALILTPALAGIAAVTLVSAQQALDTSAIAKAIGRSGTSTPDGVYRVSFPRSDLSHMIGDTPALYYMHFWAVDTPSAVASGLKNALSHVAVKGP